MNPKVRKKSVALILSGRMNSVGEGEECCDSLMPKARREVAEIDTLILIRLALS